MATILTSRDTVCRQGLSVLLTDLFVFSIEHYSTRHLHPSFAHGYLHQPNNPYLCIFFYFYVPLKLHLSNTIITFLTNLPFSFTQDSTKY